MQSDAFPTPPIYSHNFQPRLAIADPESWLTPRDSSENSEIDQNYLLNEIELLIADCSQEESKSFWLAADRIKIKHQVIESMQKIESLFLELAKESTQDPDLISVVSESLLYSSNSTQKINIPEFVKHQIY
ncbi:hypothetical protein H6F42_16235 [Pseudanabaena sp. FACHB-1998]|uniref:hypothetical protein n=1 Tax=Pseudanabaena sp. FACHB-1998 TaxID=2692858 RepID=UPI001680FE62|nr:hypothetical protein [Pseudanabaena sp. FACHB-1998]MBD2178468.1 hypothetical protein [Pseudanabaena sp. FACHB-1998]